MAEFASKNKGTLTVFIILFAILLGSIDGYLEKDSNTTIQWIILSLTVISIMYIHFFAGISEIEYDEEEYIGVANVPSLQDKQVEELTEVELNDAVDNIAFIDKHNERIDKNGNWTNEVDAKLSKEKVFYVMQPIHVTQEEFDNKINNNNLDMETKDQHKSLNKAPADPNIVIGYSLHNIHKKFRPMYNDICEFAINGGVKSESEITAKLKPYGYKFTTERANTTTLAFNVESDPKIRIPESGYFGIK